jgi:hypothetical protein
MMDELGVEVAELHETANLLRRRHLPVCNGLDFHCVIFFFQPTQCSLSFFHLLTTEEALSNAQLQALLFETLKYYETQVFQVFVERATIDTDVVEVDNNELV